MVIIARGPADCAGIVTDCAAEQCRVDGADMTQVERRGCAFHEAGHAIVGMALGRRLSKVEIGVDGDPSQGRTDFEDQIPLCMIDGLALCCAGKAAERMFGAALLGRALLLDRYWAEQILQPISVDQWPALKRAGYRRAWRILRANQEAVIRLADELIEICGRTPPHQDQPPPSGRNEGEGWRPPVNC
jgi:hypothetical protein